MDRILGIDIGTTGTKSALFSVEGELIDISSVQYRLAYPREGWVEQNAEDWWQGLVKTVRELLSRNGNRESIKALSLSTQGGALVLLNKKHKPIHSAVSWLDTRAKETCSSLGEKIKEDELYGYCGWNWLTGLLFPTIYWFREKERELFNKTEYFASTIDFLHHRLTGRFAIDYSNLAMNELLDIAGKDYADYLLEIAGIERKNVPGLLPSGEVVGTLTGDASDQLGLPCTTRVICGGHDQYCANIGAGAVNAGDCVLSSGTAWVLLATADRVPVKKNLLVHPGIHPIKNMYGLMTSVPSGGNSLSWFQSTFAHNLNFEQLSEAAGTAECGSGGVIFIPKHTSKTGKASFLQIDTSQDMQCFIRALFEGVAFANRRHIEAIDDMGMKVCKLIMIGGGAKSTAWPGIVADVSRIPVLLPEQKECACTGAAVIAVSGTGYFNSIEEAGRRFNKIKLEIDPVPNKCDRYDDLYKDFIRYTAIV